MDTTHASPSPSAPHFAIAGTVLDAMAAHDFDQLAPALEDDATLSALLPKGLREWEGAAEICAQFERWFGDVEHYEVADAAVGQIGALLELRWRLRLRGVRLGPEPMVVEQHLYARTGESGRISQMSLLCSGFWAEHADA